MAERTLRTALAVSVVLNLFAIGAAAGGAIMWLSLGHPAAAVRGRPIRTAADALPPAERAQYLSLLRTTMAETLPIQKVAKENRRLAAALFVQPQFDSAAVDAALERARNADLALRTRLETTMVSFAQTLPQADRAILANGLARGGPLRRPNRGDHSKISGENP